MASLIVLLPEAASTVSVCQAHLSLWQAFKVMLACEPIVINNVLTDGWKKRYKKSKNTIKQQKLDPAPGPVENKQIFASLSPISNKNPFENIT